MNTRSLAGAAVASLFVIAGCMQDKNSSPLVPSQPSFAKPPATGTCLAASTMSSDAKAYFVDSKDPIFALLDSVKTANGVSAANATPVGFRALTRLAQAANAGASLVKGDPVQGSKVANDVLGCMSVAGYTSPTDFSGALGTKGIFAVRSDARLDPVISRFFLTSGTLFGAERGQAGSWYARLAGAAYSNAFLFYGSKLPDSPTFNNEDTAGVVFDLSTLPAPLSFMKITTVGSVSDTVPTLKAGVCDMSATSAQILHDHNGSAILPQSGVPGFCTLTSTPSIGFLNSPFPNLAFAAKRVANWFTPQPLMAGVGGGSALLSGLSHVGPVTFTVNPTSGVFWSTQPSKTKLTASPQFNPPIAVTVLTSNGTAISGVKVSLSVAGNSGSFVPPADSVRYTNASGVASFPNYYLNKAGGYTITATTVYGSKISKLFNVSGQ